MRRVVVLVLGLLVLAPAGVRAATWYRSSGDGEVRARCCCPVHPGQRGPAAPASELRSACCCTIIALAARDAAERQVQPAPEAGAMPAIAAAVTPVAALPADAVSTVDGSRVTRGPPPHALFARHCALLL